MPVFKFAVPTNSGEILVHVDMDGAAQWETTGNVVLSGLVSVCGLQDVPTGAGNILLTTSLFGQSEGAVGDGDISVICSIVGHSKGANLYKGSGNILFYPFQSIILDGEAILNGLGSGSILLDRIRFDVGGGQGACGSVSASVQLDGEGACRVGGGDIVLVGRKRFTVGGMQGARGSVFASARLDGEAILNGLGLGSILLDCRCFEVGGRQGALGSVPVSVRIDGAGAYRVGGGDIVFQPVVTSGAATQEEIDTNRCTGSLILGTVNISGRGGFTAKREMSCSGSVIVCVPAILGAGVLLVVESDDAVLRYESHRRHI